MKKSENNSDRAPDEPGNDQKPGPRVDGPMAIHRLLLQTPQTYFSRATLAKALQISERTVERTLTAMRFTHALPVGYNREFGGYHYTQGEVHFAGVHPANQPPDLNLPPENHPGK